MKPYNCFYALVAFAICGAFGSASAQPQTLSDEARRQIRALHDEKESRTPAQRKMDSQLIYAAKQNRGQAIAANVPLLKHTAKLLADGRVLVDIKANVTDPLLQALRDAGGEVVNSHPQFQAVRALIPIAKMETLAALTDVNFIRPADEFEVSTGSLNTEGDTTHAAATARTSYGVNGTGIKVGVLSDSVDGLATSQASGDLGTVTILPGQGSSGTGEGTALLEIIHDLAPGAQLYFATGNGGQANFANNILNLRAAGCDILVDDLGYFAESPFQDGVVAQAVNTITTGGGLYFSSAGNSGNKNDGTSGTWEGDFADGGAASPPINDSGGRIHDFGGGTTYNTVTAGGSDRRVDLFWADPLGGSTNDYDVYVLDSTGTSVLRSSTTWQNGSQDPYESIGTLNVGERIVIVQSSGTNRFLHLNTGRGRLAISTAGNTHGHDCATNAYCVAATSALNSYPNPFTGGVANPVEGFSSDGPRRVFFQADGTAITPGNYSSTGGAVRQKPDLTAADGVKTAVAGFNPFYGTSAAAPHAAAIAALLKSYRPALTPAQIRISLTTTALDIEADGYDRDSGAGIVMAQPALQWASSLPVFSVASTSLMAEGCPPGNGVIDPDEVVTVNFALTNSGGSTANLVVTLLATNGVSSPSVPQSYGALIGGGGVVVRPFTFTANGTCGGICTAVFQLQDGSTNYGTVNNSFRLGVLVSSSYSSGGVAVAIPDNTPAGVEVPILVTDAGAVADVNVRVRLNHTYDSDLVIALVHPDGTVVTLVSKRGGAGDNYGSGATNCSGTFTVFDDAASTPINSGAAPFAGSYRPTQLLSTLNGKSVVGIWKLRVTDTGGGDVGTLYCFQLDIARQQYDCCGGNAAPTLTGIEGSALIYVANQPATAITATLTATDDGNLTNATVGITGGFVSGEDLLAMNPNPQNGISAVYSANVLTLTGDTNAASYQDALRSVTYANTSYNPSTALRTVTFTVKDAGGLSGGNQSRNITVTSVNDPPIANDVSEVTDENTAKTITLSGSDVETCELTFSIVSNPSHGTLDGPTNQFTCIAGSPNRDTNTIVYTPAANYNGPDSFTYKVNDGTADSATATVNITVSPVNSAPVAMNDLYSVTMSGMLEVGAPGVLGNDTDVDGDTLTAILVSTTSHGTLTLTNNGGFTYAPETSYTGSDSFTYRANDGQANSEIATVGITVNPVPNPPPVVSFEADPTNGMAPLTVVFTNHSSGATNYYWSFGDGNSSTSDNPANVYTNAGTYSVTLTGIGPGGTNSLTVTPCIVVTNNCFEETTVLFVTKNCPAYPVPPGGMLSFTGTVTNAGNVILTNVFVLNDHPTTNTIIFGPAILPPGQGAEFAGNYRVSGCGPYSDTLTAFGQTPCGTTVTNFATVTCPGTNVFVSGDLNGDGIVDQSELDIVLSNYWAHSQWVYMTNATSLGNGFFQFALTNANAWNFSVLVSSDLTNWTTNMYPAYPVYQFVDPEAATNASQRFYRLQWP
jgi:PKD repeat protein/subtilisin-like proprotein convertase family protein